MEFDKCNILHKYIRLVGGKVTITSLKEFFELCPDFNNIVSFPKALNFWDIDNIILNIDFKNYFEVPTPHILFTSKEKGTFLLVENRNKDEIWIIESNHKRVKYNLNQIESSWTGLILLAETNADSGDKKYSQNRTVEVFKKNIEIIMALLLLTAIASFLSIFGAFTYFTSLFIFTKTLGVVFSLLILNKSYNYRDKLSSYICSLNKKNDCNTILNSNAAKITFWLSWADLGFIYFSSTLLILLLSCINEATYNFIFIQYIFGAICVVFSVYSVYYQARVAKSICLLCIGIISVFWIECSLSLLFSSIEAIPNLIYLMSLGLIVLPLTIIALILYKHKINQPNLSHFKDSLKYFKNDGNFINFIFRKTLAEPPFLGLNPIIIGDINAHNTLSLVSNPLCPPCKDFHQKMEKIVSITPNFKCEVIFLTMEDSINESGKIVRKLFNLPFELQAKALNLWYSGKYKNFTDWNTSLGEYPENIESSVTQQLQNQWIKTNKINATPFFYFNGQILPNIMGVEDIPHIISVLEKDKYQTKDFEINNIS